MVTIVSGLAAISGQTAVVVRCPVCGTSGEYVPINMMQSMDKPTEFSGLCFACSNTIVIGVVTKYKGLPGKWNESDYCNNGAYSGLVCWK